MRVKSERVKVREGIEEGRMGEACEQRKARELEVESEGSGE